MTWIYWSLYQDKPFIAFHTNSADSRKRNWISFDFVPRRNIDDARCVLRLKLSSKHCQKLNQGTSGLIGDHKVSFWDSQISGVVYMMQRAWGTIPIDPLGVQDEDENFIIKACWSIVSSEMQAVQGII